MKYTISKKADKKVERDLRIIKDIIIKRLDPVSIILFGGFGRGEGSFEISKGSVLPLNDYDLYVVTKKKINDEKLEHLGLECSEAIGRGGLEFVEHTNARYDKNKFFHVDIRCLALNSLPYLLPTQRTAELKNSTIIHGEDVRNLIPKKEVPVSEAIRLLFNKMDHFLLAEKNSKEIKTIYAVKGYIDSCTALTIFYKRYKPSYGARIKEIEKINIPAELKKKIKWAHKFRLKVNFNAIKDVDKLFEDSKYWTGWAFRHIMTRHLKTKSESWREIARAMYRKLPYIYFQPYMPSRYLFPLQYGLTLKFFIEGLKNKEIFVPVLFSWRDAGIKAAIPLMLYLYKEEKEAEKYLRKITIKTKPLKERILKTYSIYYLQKLI